MIERRRFLATATGALGTVALVDAPSVIAQPKIQWRMSTAFTPALDVHQRAATQLAKIVEETSGGGFKIEVFPGGQIMQPFDCFDAAAQGTIEAFMGGSYYWTAPGRPLEKEPAAEWFSTVPFGMNVEGMTAWCQQADGLKLWEETYAAFNLVPRPGPGHAGRAHPRAGRGTGRRGRRCSPRRCRSGRSRCADRARVAASRRGTSTGCAGGRSPS